MLSSLRSGARPPIIVYAPEAGEFGDILAAAPVELKDSGLFDHLAIEWHGGAHRDMSARLTACALGARVDQASTFVQMGHEIGAVIRSSCAAASLQTARSSRSLRKWWRARVLRRFVRSDDGEGSLAAYDGHGGLPELQLPELKERA